MEPPDERRGGVDYEVSCRCNKMDAVSLMIKDTTMDKVDINKVAEK
jgi:hypothetical protein